MADLVLVRYSKTRSPAAGRALLTRLREAALAVLPGEGKVGTIGGGRFKITLPGHEGTVDAQGALFELDEPDFTVVRLIYELAKAGGLAWVDSWGPASTIVFDRAAVKTLPTQFRRPRPAVCTSARHLARMMGVSPREDTPVPQRVERPWTRGFDKRARHKPPGLDPPPRERYVYIQLMPDENIDVLMKRLWAFIRTSKKAGKFEEPKGGGISFGHGDNWQIRLAGGQVLIAWHVTGYESRVNKDHLVPANLEAWLGIAHDFARASGRKIAAIENGKTLVVRGGGHYPINRLEYRRFEPD